MNLAMLLAAAVMFAIFSAKVNAEESWGRLVIPEVAEGAKRLIEIDDVASLREVDTLSVSPDAHHFAIFVHQGDAALNDYRTGWFVGDANGSVLTYVGDGGEARPQARPAGQLVGEIAGGESRWSPDGEWIAYTLQRDDEVQLWRSRLDGSVQEQITHNAANVREFAWSEDGRMLYFTCENLRAEQRASGEARERQGYRYDDDLYDFSDFLLPRRRGNFENSSSVWVVTVDDGHERLGVESERTALKHAQALHDRGTETETRSLHDIIVSRVARADGGTAWLQRSSPMSSVLHVVASLSAASPQPITCLAEECSGAIRKVWWSDDAERVLFWRDEGIGGRMHGFYSWSPVSGAVLAIMQVSDDDLRDCGQIVGDRLICVRESPAKPAHIAVIDLRSGIVKAVADVNPEFRNIRLGRVERFEWDTPTFEWSRPGGKLAGLFSSRAYGYILYPPDFEPNKTYPVFIDPYIAHGFSPVGAEHALQVYAANGIVVLRIQLPSLTDAWMSLGGNLMKQLYSAELDFPYLTMLSESAVRGLDAAEARGFIDGHRVGIGGVSHGTFVPLYMMQKHDRIAAISISGPGWGQQEYYWGTRKGRESVAAASGNAGYTDWKVKPDDKGREFWSRIDIADHIDTIEAPILMQLSAAETFGVRRLIRHLAEENKPYDAYVFRDETHIKWQPAHLRAILSRNLDWFRFWLQGYEDPDLTKAEQYSRWRTLRQQQADRIPTRTDGE